MSVIDRSVRLPLVLFAVCGSLALGLFVWIEFSSKPPVTLPLNSGMTRSAPFRVYDDGLYLVVLRIDDHGDRDRILCALGAKPHGATCVPATLPFSWVIYRGGEPYVAPGPENAVDDVVRSYPGIAERDLGSVRLKPGGGYVLEVLTSRDIQTPALRRPTVVVREHPWEVKLGGGIELLLVFAGASLAAAVTLLWLLIEVLGDALSRRRGRP